MFISCSNVYLPSVCGVIGDAAICNSHVIFIKSKINNKLTLNGYSTLKDKLHHTSCVGQFAVKNSERLFDSSIILNSEPM